MAARIPSCEHELIYNQLLWKARRRLQRRAEVHLRKEGFLKGRAEERYGRCSRLARIYVRWHGHGDSTAWGGKTDWLTRLVLRLLHRFLRKGREWSDSLAGYLSPVCTGLRQRGPGVQSVDLT